MWEDFFTLIKISTYAKIERLLLKQHVHETTHPRLNSEN